MKYWICVCGLLLKCFVDSILIVEKYEIYKLLVYFVFINYYGGWYMVVVLSDVVIFFLNLVYINFEIV